MSKLADCPWCGKQESRCIWHTKDVGFTAQIKCCSCGAHGPEVFSLHGSSAGRFEAVAEWDRVAGIVTEFKADNARRNEATEQFLEKFKPPEVTT